MNACVGFLNMRVVPGLGGPQDFVKWRGQLFHQFLRALVDNSGQVRALAEYLLADTLCHKVGDPPRSEGPPCTAT